MALKENIQRIEVLEKELNSHRPIDPAQERRIMDKFRLEWNFHSNHIEGNKLEYGETKALLLFGITAQGKPLKDHIEMQAHNEALKYIEEIVKEDRPLTEQFIRDLNNLILKSDYQVDAITPDGQPTKKWVRVGEYKREPNHVLTRTGEIFRFAEPNEVPALMNELIQWYRTEKEKTDFNAFLVAAEFHYRFIRIHPFDDGNGRTARILMNFILMQSGLPPIIIPTQEKSNYLNGLEQADAGNIEAFFTYLSEKLITSLELMNAGARGEAIEDEDDLDKALAVLKNKVETIGVSKEVKQRDRTLVLKVLNEAFIPVLFEYDKQWAKFRDYFEENMAQVQTQPGKTQKFEWLPDERDLFWAGSNLDNIEVVSLKIVLRKLKVLLPEIKHFELGFNIQFSEYEYSIVHNIPKTVTNKYLYGTPINKEELIKTTKVAINRFVSLLDKTISSEKGL
ncbi:Fic family protein [Yeosuana marina]|uniref:Fic family protein n=1 Tax=Yeosuana marina TaxID=1565536 RepID=UPI0030C7E6F8